VNLAASAQIFLKSKRVSAEGTHVILSCVLDCKTFHFSIHSLQSLDK
jgi:hypothetical protein